MTAVFHVMTSNVVATQRSRVSFDMEVDGTLLDAVNAATRRTDVPASRIRVVLSGDNADWEIAPALWSQIKPKPGIQVLMRTVPGRDNLRSILTIVVSAAAVAFAPGLVAGFGGGAFATSLATAGLTIVGTLLINALIPVQIADTGDQSSRNTYTIQGWRNEARPGAPVPLVLGKMRYAPPFAATSYSEIVGDQQYIRALFTAGYGPVRFSDLRIGETPIEDFDDIDIEIRDGLPDDAPVSLYPRQILEESLGLQLTRPFPRDDAGEIVEDSESTAQPIIGFTATDASQASVILGFPQGLFRVNSKGDLRSQSVTVQIRMRLNSAEWIDVETLKITAQNREPMFRQHTWTLPSRARWEIEVTRMTDELTATDASDSVVLSAIQSIRPEYPINFGKPLSLVAIRVRATYQLNGTLDNFNALIERAGPVHLGDGVWGEDYSRNPATAYMIALTGNQNPFPAAESEIDMDQMADWYDWNAAKGLEYNRIHDQGESLGEMLMSTASAGRAGPRHDGVEWGVVIDRPDDLIIEHINDRNSDTFTFSQPKFDRPDAFRVRFLDETNNYAPAEMIIPWPGHVGEINLSEELALPGKTNPVEIWIEARRRQYELEHRTITYSVMQSGRARLAERGDTVMGNFDVLDSEIMSARVKSVRGSLVELDEEIPASTGLGIRFKAYAGKTDKTGISRVRAVADRTETTTALRVLEKGPMPSVGEAVHIGPFGTESIALRIKGIEGAQNADARVIMVASAPEIDELTDAEVPPAWDGRVGDEINASVLEPDVPRFVHIRTGVDGTGVENGFEVLLKPGSGSTSIVTSYEIDHRLDGASAWTTITIPAASASADIDGYVLGDIVDLQARAISTNTPGDYTAEITVTIGAEDPSIPSALDASAIDVTGSLGHAIIGVGIPPDDAITSLQFYRSPEGASLDRETHGVRTPISVQANATATFIDGDATRENELTGGAFDGADSWMVGTGWTIASGVASHAVGTASDLSKSMSLVAGATYRISFDISAMSAGTVTPKFTGGTAVAGAAISNNGLAQLTVVAGAGNNTFTLTADTDFDGAVDDIIIFRETASCVDAGRWDYWIEPQNSAGVAGPVSGPFSTTIY